MQTPIDSFVGEYRWLSNFWIAPFFSTLHHLVVPTVEHAFQAAKMTNYDDTISVLAQLTPGRAKRLGRSLPKRENWDEIKERAMWISLVDKFSNPYLRQKLIETEDRELIEGNTWGDVYWGVCNGVGENRLGKLLMRLRESYNANAITS